MKDLIETRDRIFVKKAMDFVLLGKNVSSYYGQKHLDITKMPPTDTLKTAWRRVIQKTAEATGDMFGYKIEEKTAKSMSKTTYKAPSKLSSLVDETLT